MKTFFVSSTFRDMQQERDVIQGIVTAEVNHIAKQYGDEVVFSDLRWGINTIGLDESEEAKKVLESCLDEIDRCSPYMIVILGDRYGWIPDRELMERTISGRDFQLDELEKSVTALEIEYGPLKNNSDQLSNTLFYFREIAGDPSEDYLSEDEDHRKKLEDLKKRIQKATHNKAKTYQVFYKDGELKGMDDFAQMLIHDTQKLLLPKWEHFNSLTPLDKILYKESVFIARTAYQYAPIKSVVDSILEKLYVSDIVTVTGEAGTGKTALMSYLAYELPDLYINRFVRDNLFEVFPIFCGIMQETSNALNILKCIRMLVIAYKDESMYIVDEEIGKECYENLINDISLRLSFILCTPIIILIDSIENLPWIEQKLLIGAIKKFASGSVKFLITTNSMELSGIINGNNLEMPVNLMASNKKELIEYSLSGRQIDGSVLEKLLNHPKSGSAVYLKFLVKYIQMLERDDFSDIYKKGGTSQEIAEKQIEIIEKASYDLKVLIQQYIQKCTHLTDAASAAEPLIFIASSLNGLKIKDLQNIISEELNYVDLIRILNYCSDLFIIRNDGQYLFNGKVFSDAVLEMTSEKVRRYVHQRLFEYFRNKKKESGYILEEYLYQCIRADHFETFRNEVLSYADISLLVYRTVMEFGTEWLADHIVKSEKYDFAFYEFLCSDFYNQTEFTEDELKKLFLIMEAVSKKCLSPDLKMRGSKTLASMVLSNLGDLFYHFGDMTKARDYFEQARLITPDVTDTKGINVSAVLNLAMTLNNNADVIRSTDPQTAFEYNRKALQLIIDLRDKIEKLGKKLPEKIENLIMHDLSFAYKNMATAYIESGGPKDKGIKEIDKAIQYELEDYKIAKILYEKNATEENKNNYAYSNEFLAILYALKKDPKRKNHLETALKLYEELYSLFQKDIYEEHILALLLLKDAPKKHGEGNKKNIYENLPYSDLKKTLFEKLYIIRLSEKPMIAPFRIINTSYYHEVLDIFEELEKRTGGLSYDLLYQKYQITIKELRIRLKTVGIERDAFLHELIKIKEHMTEVPSDLLEGKEWMELINAINEEYYNLLRSLGRYKDAKHAQKELDISRRKYRELYSQR